MSTQVQVQEMVKLLREIKKIDVDLNQLQKTRDELEKKRADHYERLGYFTDATSNNSDAVIEQSAKIKIAEYYLRTDQV